MGLHTGELGVVRIRPGQPGTGIVLRSAVDGQEAAVVAANIHSTTRCTAVRVGDRVIQTVEHLLSALNGLGVTDAVVEFDGPEVPILDGSAIGFVESILSVGIATLDVAVEPIRIAGPFVLTGPGGGVATVVPADSLAITVVLDYSNKPAMEAVAASYDGSLYAERIAPARTFGFVSELEYLAKMGLAKGASVDNAFALNDDGSPDASTPLRFANETARHKVLDLVGDLVFAGRPVAAHIVALRPSHALNTQLATELAARFALQGE